MKKVLIMLAMMNSIVLLGQSNRPYAEIREVPNGSAMDSSYIVWIKYTSFGSVESRTGQDYDTITNTWINKNLTETKFDKNQQGIRTYYSVWNLTINKYDSLNRYRYDTTFSPHLISFTDDYTGSGWTTNSIDTLFNDSKGLTYLSASYNDPNGNGNIKPYGKFYTYFNNDDKVSLQYGLLYDSINQSYDSTYKSVYGYNTVLNRDSSYHYYLGPNGWVYISFNYTIHDYQNNSHESVNNLWNSSTSSFENSSKWIINYYPDGRTNQHFSYAWNNNASDYDLVSRTTYLYESSVGVSSIEPEFDFNIYPNPAYNIVTITISGEYQEHIFNLYSSNGQLINTFSSDKSTISIDVSGLKNGLYHLMIKDTKDVVVKNLVINR